MTEASVRGERAREGRQRWRIRYGRDASAAQASQRDESELWARALGEAFLTIVRSGHLPTSDERGLGRPRLALGPALPVGAEADEEPLEFELSERMTLPDVRTRLEETLPPGHRLVDLHDVWVGAPSLPALVRELEYRIEVNRAPREVLATAADGLLRADRLERERTRGSRGGTFDLRPLVVDLRVERGRAAEGATAAVLRFVARVDPALGVGRPDDVLAALSEPAGVPLVANRIVRTRVRLADD